MHEAIQLIAEEYHVLPDYENLPIRTLMFLGNAAKKHREDKERVRQAQEKALNQR